MQPLMNQRCIMLWCFLLHDFLIELTSYTLSELMFDFLQTLKTLSLGVIFPNDNLTVSFLQLITALGITKNGHSRITEILGWAFLTSTVSITIKYINKIKVFGLH